MKDEQEKESGKIKMGNKKWRKWKNRLFIISIQMHKALEHVRHATLLLCVQ